LLPYDCLRSPSSATRDADHLLINFAALNGAHTDRPGNACRRSTTIVACAPPVFIAAPFLFLRLPALTPATPDADQLNKDVMR
jgi:hypothetical protein